MTAFFRRVNAVPGVPETYVALIEGAQRFRRAAESSARVGNRPNELLALARLRKVLGIIDYMEAEYRNLAVESARLANAPAPTGPIKRDIEATSTRPPTTGHLAAGIHSTPLPVARFPAGEVGLVDLDQLDRATTRHGARRTYKPYWRAQEYGYGGNVGRIVPGWFYPPRAKPNAAEFRLHPFFEFTGPKSPKGTPAMLIQKEIEPRHFLHTGVADVVLAHFAGARAIDSTVTARLRSL